MDAAALSGAMACAGWRWGSWQQMAGPMLFDIDHVAFGCSSECSDSV